MRIELLVWVFFFFFDTLDDYDIYKINFHPYFSIKDLITIVIILLIFIYINFQNPKYIRNYNIYVNIYALFYLIYINFIYINFQNLWMIMTFIKLIFTHIFLLKI